MAGKPIAAASAPAAKKTEVVHEYVLYRQEGDVRVPLMSDHDLDVVKQAKVNAIASALANGQARPALGITDRKCEFPLAGGKRQALGSTCEETEL